MANPSSHDDRDHRDRDRERERRHRSDRERSSASHHHRTISSTTLLLVLSLILAVLAVMLSLPNSAGPSVPIDDSSPTGLLGLITPKRSQALIAREHGVAVREAEVARREAELLLGAPGGVINQASCPICPEPSPVQTIVKEVTVTATPDALAPWQKDAGIRLDDILDRELKIAEREREISKREEGVNRREHDASRREAWIMEQLVALGNDYPQVDEEYIYDPSGRQRKLKGGRPLYVAGTPDILLHTVTETAPPSTVTVPAPAGTRKAAYPSPDSGNPTGTPATPRTIAVEVPVESVTVVHRPKALRRPARWFGGW